MRAIKVMQAIMENKGLLELMQELRDVAGDPETTSYHHGASCRGRAIYNTESRYQAALAAESLGLARVWAGGAYITPKGWHIMNAIRSLEEAEK